MKEKTKEERDKAYNRFLTTSIAICLVLICYLLTTLVVIKMRYKDYGLENYSIADYYKVNDYITNKYYELEGTHVLTVATAEEKIKQEIQPKFYILIKAKPFIDYASGITLPPFRIIVVDADRDQREYLTDLAHEFVHLKYMVANETWTQFNTFKILYESKNKYLNYLACHLAINIFHGIYPKEYRCIGNIVNYIKSKEVLI